MFYKKAQIEIQFNWIFVIIAGVVLLGFFLMLIANQTNTAEQKISISLMNHFRSILDSTSQKEGTFKIFDFPSNFKTEFICDNDLNLHYYKLQDMKVTDIKYDIIFTPPNLYGRHIYTWTQEWELPNEQGFSVGNFLYLTNSKIGYIFRNSSLDLVNELFVSFPDNVSKLLSNGETFKEKNFDKYIYLVFSDIIESSPQIFDNDFHEKSEKIFIVIKPAKTDDLFNYGNLCFCNNLNNCWVKDATTNQYYCAQNSTIYLGESSLYGAIFTGDYNYYNCMMQKAFDKLKLTTSIQYYWIQDILAAGNVDYFCQVDLTDVSGWLISLSDPEYIGTSMPILDNSFENIAKSSTLTDSLISLLDLIHKRNQILALGQNCVQLY